jgi:hypothetical protein
VADQRETHGGAVGDTDEVHDTIHPHDLPPSHPGRRKLERELAKKQEEPGGARRRAAPEQDGSG